MHVDKLCVILLVLVNGILYFTGASEIIMLPSYLTAQLKGTLAFNVTWRTEQGAVVVFTQLFDGKGATEVLTVNGSDAQLLNNWNDKATVDVGNDTDTTSVQITLNGVTIEEEGRYKMHIRADGKEQTETLFNTAYFRIVTYALPISIQMQVERTVYNESMDAIFVCSGNIGRPMGNLRLLQSSSDLSGTFYTVENIDPAKMEELFASERLSNGTYPVSHEFHLNISSAYNATYFKCDVIHEIPNITLTESSAVQVFVNFCCMKLEVVPTNVVLSDTGNEVFTVRCSPTTQTPAIASITSIRLYRYTQWDIGQTELNNIAAIVYFTPNTPTFIGNPTDLTTAPRSANLTGRLNSAALADGNVDLEANFYIQLQLQRRYVQCKDVGMYGCKVTYVDKVGVSHDDEGSQNLTVTARPSNISMEVKKNGAVVYKSSSGPQSAPADFDVGDVVEIRCMAKTGSDKATLIKWRKVPEYTSDFQNWTPTTSTDDLDSETPVDCSYSRTVTMEYNVTLSDSQRADSMHLAFQCIISDGTFQTGNAPSFYIDAGSGNSVSDGENEGASTAEGTSNTAAIIGGVIGGLVAITIIVVVICLLWFRRKDGDSYRTKEERGSENPNMAPNTADHYSVPHKDRGRGRENKGLDEPHETKPHHNYRNADDYSNGKGRPNYGMDREDDEYSRDGSPTAMRESINHMGNPHGSIGTGV